MDWSMEKVARSKLVALFNDQSDEWLLDVDVALFEYWCTGGSELYDDDEQQKWMFPYLARVVRPCDKVNGLIKSCT
jgi:hypothetical protein